MTEMENERGAGEMTQQSAAASIRSHPSMTTGMGCVGGADEINARARRPRFGSRGRGENGASLVEFALILPVLLMLMLGLFTGGMAYNRKLDVTHAVREGSRYGATIPTTQMWCDSCPSGPTAWQRNIAEYVKDKAAGTLSGYSFTPGSDVYLCVALVQGATPSVVSGRTTKSDGTPCFTDDPYPSFHVTNDPGRRVQVLAERDGEIDLGVFPSVDYRIKSRAVTKSETSL